MLRTLTRRLGATALKRAVLLGLIGAVLMSFMAVNTLTSTSKATTVKLSNETLTSDADVAITFNGLSKANNTQAAAGDIAPGVEAISTLPPIQTVLNKNNYVYTFELKEAAIASWPAARQYKVQVYGDDGTNVNLLATLYTQQATSDVGLIDGVTVKVDTGASSTAHDAYSVIVTKVQ